MKRPLTKLQKRLLRYLKFYIFFHGYAPKIEDIKKKFGWTSNATAFDIIERLEKGGWISKEKSHWRSIVINK